MAQFRMAVRAASFSLVAALTITACTGPDAESTSTPKPNSTSGGTDAFYEGPIPAPSKLPELGTRPTPPVETTEPTPPPAEPYDYQAHVDYYAAWDKWNKSRNDGLNDYYSELITYSEQSSRYNLAIEQLAVVGSTGGREAVAAWEALLVAAGIAVTGPDGKPVTINDDAGFGWPLTDAELRLHALLAAAPGGMPISDFAEVLGGLPELAATDVDAELLNMLMNSSTEAPSFYAVFESIAAEPYQVDYSTTPAEDVFLTWGQVSLLTRRLAAEIASHAAGLGPVTPVHLPRIIKEPGFDTSLSAAVTKPKANGPCDLRNQPPWAQKLVKKASEWHAKMFKWVIDKLDKTAKTQVGKYLNVGQALSAFDMLIAKAAALTATFEMARSPLIRTHETVAGETRELTVKFQFAAGTWEAVRRCLNLFGQPFGWKFPPLEEAAAQNVDVELRSENTSVLLVGDNESGGRPDTSRTSDEYGVTKFTVIGAPQPEPLPSTATPEDISVGLRAVSNIEGNDIFEDIKALPSFGKMPGISELAHLLAKLQFITHYGSVEVRDWILLANFAAELRGNWAGHQAANTLYHCTSDPSIPPWLFNESSDVTGFVKTERLSVRAWLLPLTGGNVGDLDLVFTPGDHKAYEPIPFQPPYAFEMFEMPASFTATAVYSVPALPPVPPLYTRAAEDCELGVQDPPPQCGTATYPGTMKVIMPAERQLVAVGGEDNAPWRWCGGTLGMAAPYAWSCDPLPTGGQVPPASELFDQSVHRFMITGSSTCPSVSDGTEMDIRFEWGLELCRIVEGKPAC